jgi:hypothetical protein
MKTDFFFTFIPIVLMYMFLAYTKDTILFSNTPVGKFIAICIITYYTNTNMMYGVFVCMLILVYYQTDLVEEILYREHAEFIESRLTEMNAEIQYYFGEHHWARVAEETTIAKNVAGVSNPNQDRAESHYEGFTSNTPDIYSYKSPTYSGRIPDKPDKKEELMAMFRKEHCVNGVLNHKGAEIHTEMAEHVFREFKPDNEWNRCNPCDSTCSFSIIEERIQTESAVKPVDSNDFFQSNLESMSKIFNTATERFMDYFADVKQYATFI